VFDTFKLSKEYNCGNDNKTLEVQTKLFDCDLSYYEIGDVISNYCETTIIEEDIYCSNMKREMLIYLVIYKGIYIGSKRKKKKAEKLLQKFNKCKLIDFYKKIDKIKEKKLYKLKKIENKLDSYIKVNIKKEEHVQFFRNEEDDMSREDFLLHLLKEIQNK